MHRRWVLAAAGAVLLGTTTVLGLILFRRQGFFEVTIRELTVWLFAVVPMTTAFMGLLVVQMTARSLNPRRRFFLFGLFGAVSGLIASVVYGVFGIQEMTGCDAGFCGWSVLGLQLRSFWPALGLLATFGVILGAFGGLAAAWITQRGVGLVTTASGV